MSTDQPSSESGFRTFYKQFFDTLVQAYNATGDPAVYVYENYLRWKGVPDDGFKLQSTGAHLSPHFTILMYAATSAFSTVHTLGASFKIMPNSNISFADKRGMRYEYIIHAPSQYLMEVSNLLVQVAEYPFLHEVEYAPGFVLPIGEPVVPSSGMQHLYFTYPFVDDTRMNSDEPWGQIERPQFVIQMLWVFPIYLSEVAYIQRAGADAFEERCNERHQQQYDAFDFFREPYV
ncbi:MAG TPA: suppressor of fused domain protein [Roseiflexaceae bacterium]|jgi:hypothetical protein|nr:suppressor of fused domain protein [Roseiflexaceae bacterium]